MTTPEREVLEANSAFYAAFARGDAEAMDALWAREAPVACLHPGWELLQGREAVVESWRRILLGGGAPAGIRCESASAHVQGDWAWVVCAEVLPAGKLAATNLFVREEGLWRLVHHHASPMPPPSPRRPVGFRN
ncbi:MAG TPA: nuclear transport factor 2 family protein [Myxococcales bacterium]|nr:nuclear transport factor 2 family protein [Myxococcales bacterium]